jgi:hypothetical protein
LLECKTYQHSHEFVFYAFRCHGSFSSVFATIWTLSSTIGYGNLQAEFRN